MRKVAAVFLAVALGGCGGTKSDGYAVDLTVVLDSSVMASQVSTLTLSVTGAETYTSSAIDVTGKLTSGHAGLRYRPGVSSGTLNFSITAFDSAGGELAYGAANGVTLKTGATQTATITLTHLDNLPQDMAVADQAMPDDGPQSHPDLQPEPDLCEPKTAADCDDGNPCTVDGVSDGSCDNTCTHTPQATAIACTSGSASGVCLGASCCTGCIHNGVCETGTSSDTLCGKGGGDCADCQTDGATCTATGSTAGTCSGCTAVSCTSESRSCGTSSCGFNCGSCADTCTAGSGAAAASITHHTCSGTGTCAASPTMTSCGNYLTCHDGATCKTDTNGGCAANGDGDCISTAYCNASKVCVPKSGLGGPCVAEGQDDPCQTGLHCTWYTTDMLTLTAVCAHTVCSGCKVVNSGDWTSCDQGIPYQKDPRTFCPYVDACHSNFCDGYGNCDSGSDLLGGSRACGAATCSDGSLHGMLCIQNADGEGHTLCQSNVYGNCGGMQYNCPCATPSTCPSTTDYPGCTENR